MQSAPDYFLDVSGEVCPMTFVRAKLAIGRLGPGECLEIRLQGQEPITNLPQSIQELGHDILSMVPESGSEPFGPHRLLIRKQG